MVRSFAILGCLLMAVCPSVLLADRAAHAREHVQAAEAGHGHSHPNGHTPHHEHDQDGSPIPVPEPTAAFTARVAGCGANELAQILTFEFSSLTASDAVDPVSRIPIGPTEEQCLRPPGPSPGNNLPLRI